MSAPDVVKVCPACGSDDIVDDAVARWDVDEQDWLLSSQFETYTCCACDYEFDTPRDKPLNRNEVRLRWDRQLSMWLLDSEAVGWLQRSGQLSKAQTKNMIAFAQRLNHLNKLPTR